MVGRLAGKLSRNQPRRLAREAGQGGWPGRLRQELGMGGEAGWLGELGLKM